MVYDPKTFRPVHILFVLRSVAFVQVLSVALQHCSVG